MWTTFDKNKNMNRFDGNALKGSKFRPSLLGYPLGVVNVFIVPIYSANWAIKGSSKEAFAAQEITKTKVPTEAFE